MKKTNHARGICIATLFAMLANHAEASPTVLLGIDSFADQFVQIDPSTGLGVAVGATDLGSAGGLVFSEPTDRLLSVNVTGNNQLTALDLNAPQQVIGTIGPFNVFGLAFDTSTDTLYGVTTGDGRLLEIDPATGSSRIVGDVGFAGIFSLTYDSIANRLLAVASTTEQLIAINPETGEGTDLGFAPLDFDFVQGLAFDAETNTVFGVNSFTEQGANPTDQLFTVDLTTGEASAIGQNIGFSLIQGLSFVPTTVIPEPLSLILVITSGFPLLIARPTKRDLTRKHP